MTMLTKYIDNGNGTITDSKTGLMWKKDPETGLFTWLEAIKNFENETVNFAGFDDWRMPSLYELKTLVDHDRKTIVDHNRKAVDEFPYNFSGRSFFWSSSSGADDSFKAWLVNFNFANDNWNDKSFSNRVRLVRIGQ